MTATAVKVDEVSVSFGGVKALQNLSCSFPVNSLCAVVGTNGAGKTTLFRAIMQQVAYEGQIYLQEQPLKGMKPFKVARLGIAKTYQNIQLFDDLTVSENAAIGYLGRFGYKWRDALLPGFWAAAAKRRVRDGVVEAVEAVGLAAYLDTRIRELSYGHRKRTEIARALAARPTVLFLDEPSTGLNPAEVHELISLLERLRGGREAIVLIEHNLGMVINCADRVLVLDAGRPRFDGPVSQFRDSKELRQVFGL